jgi:uncharacterized protein YndB with AHSA1/START domain
MNPYIKENLTVLKVFLPVRADKAWELISTPKGIFSWFPKACLGQIVEGETLEFQWDSSNPDKFKVLQVVPNQYWEMEWVVADQGGKVRYGIKADNSIVFTLEVTYPRNPTGKEAQDSEVAPWSFMLANLKSIASGGPDLRSHHPSPIWKEGFIDC